MTATWAIVAIVGITMLGMIGGMIAARWVAPMTQASKNMPQEPRYTWSSSPVFPPTCPKCGAQYSTANPSEGPR